MDAFMNEFCDYFVITGNPKHFINSLDLNIVFEQFKSSEVEREILNEAGVNESNLFEILHQFCSKFLPTKNIHQKIFMRDADKIHVRIYGIKRSDEAIYDEILMMEFLDSFEITGDPCHWVSYENIAILMEDSTPGIDVRFVSTKFKGIIHRFCAEKGYPDPVFGVRGPAVMVNGKNRKPIGVSGIAIWESVLRNEIKRLLSWDHDEEESTQPAVKKAKTTHHRLAQNTPLQWVSLSSLLQNPSTHVDVDAQVSNAKVFTQFTKYEETLISKFLKSFKLTGNQTDWVCWEVFTKVMKEGDKSIRNRYLNTDFRNMMETYCTERQYPIPQFQYPGETYKHKDGNLYSKYGITRITLCEKEQTTAVEVISAHPDSSPSSSSPPHQSTDVLNSQPSLTENALPSDTNVVTSAPMISSSDIEDVVQQQETSSSLDEVSHPEPTATDDIVPFSHGTTVLHLDTKYRVHSYQQTAAGEFVYCLNGDRGDRCDHVAHQDLKCDPYFYKTQRVGHRDWIEDQFLVSDVYWNSNGDVLYRLIHHQLDDIMDVKQEALLVLP